jgi:hypothetical protein
MEQVLVVCRCFAGDFVHAYAYSHMLNHIYTHASMERPVFKASAEMHWRRCIHAYTHSRVDNDRHAHKNRNHVFEASVDVLWTYACIFTHVQISDEHANIQLVFSKPTGTCAHLISCIHVSSYVNTIINHICMYETTQVFVACRCFADGSSIRTHTLQSHTHTQAQKSEFLKSRLKCFVDNSSIRTHIHICAITYTHTQAQKASSWSLS